MLNSVYTLAGIAFCLLILFCSSCYEGLHCLNDYDKPKLIPPWDYHVSVNCSKLTFMVTVCVDLIPIEKMNWFKKLLDNFILLVSDMRENECMIYSMHNPFTQLKK